jgi:hypothetical protein
MSIRSEMEKMKKDADDAMKRLAHIESENEKIVSVSFLKITVKPLI